MRAGFIAWVLFCISVFLSAFYFLMVASWLHRTSLESLNTTILSGSISDGIWSFFWIPIALLIVPILFRIAHEFVKFRNVKQVLLFVGTAWLLGTMFYILRMASIKSSINSQPKIAGAENTIMFSKLQFEFYFLVGSMIGCMIAAFFFYVRNQKLTSNFNGKL